MSDVLGGQWAGKSDLYWHGLHRALKRDQGFSVDRQGYSPTSGYMVSNPHGEERMPVSQAQPEHLASFSQRNEKELAEPGAHHGAWVEGGSLYQDVSRRFEPHEWGRAYSSMVASNQQAMYDVGGHNRGTTQSDTNPAYQHELVDDPTRRQHRSVSRSAGANVGESSKSSPQADRAQAWFAVSIPAAVGASRRRGAGLLRNLRQEGPGRVA